MVDNTSGRKYLGIRFGWDEVLAVLCCFLWGSCPSITKISYAWYKISPDDIISMIFMAGVRFVISGLMTISIISIKNKKLIKPKKSEMKYVIIIGFIQTALQYAMFYPGMGNALGVRCNVITALTSFFVMLLASVFFKEKLTILKIAGCLIGFFGVAYMSLSGTAAGGPVTFIGEGLILLATIAFSFSSILNKKYSNKIDPATLSAYQLLFGGMILTALGGSLGGKIQPSNIWQLGGLLYLAANSAFCYTVWTSLFKRNEAYHISSFKLTEPIFGVILSAFILSEASKVNWPKCILALTLVSIGILLSNRPERNKP